MPKTYRRWPNEGEARAFAAGVEHANDSALQIREVYEDEHPREPWVVLMEDADAETDDDPAQDLPDAARPRVT